jgi:hypothetical protein
MGKASTLVEGDVADVRLLGHDGKLQWSRTDEGLVIKMPEKKPCDFAFAFKITGLTTNASADVSNLPYVPRPAAGKAPTKGKPTKGKAAAGKAAAQAAPGRLVEPAADGSLTLGADAAETHGSRIKAEQRGGQPNLGFWDNAQDWASWKAITLASVIPEKAR